MRHPLWAKAGALCLVLLGLLWALNSVSQVVRERQGRLRDAQRSVAESLAASQTVLGPILSRSCTETWPVVIGQGPDTKRESDRNEFTVYALPKQLHVIGNAGLEPRHRGIFKVNGYALNIELKADWPDLSDLQPKPTQANSVIECAAPELMLALGDGRGIRKAIVRVDGHDLPVLPGTLHPMHKRGLHAVLPERSPAHAPLSAELILELVGTQTLAFVPIADANQVQLASNWPHPSFGGRFLPTSKQLSAGGFSANWAISRLATTAQDGFLAGLGVCRFNDAAFDNGSDGAAGGTEGGAQTDKASLGNCLESFGVSFIDPVNAYVLSDRATKYGLLFIALTFVAVGLIEVMRRLRVHPIQYLLVGSALVVFFWLLVSLSEHWPFAWAYWVAASACTALLTYYAIAVLRGWTPGLAFGGGIGMLFAALYLLLQLEQGSLVLGSVLLFLVLAAVMAVTRKLDWFALTAQLRAEPSAADDRAHRA